MAGEPASAVRVLVAGGGIAAVELVVALRKLAGDRVQIAVLAPEDELSYLPLLVAEPFGSGSAHRFQLDEVLADLRATRRPGRLAGARPAEHEALAEDGTALAYDALALAIGARRVPVVDGALTFGDPVDVTPFRALLERLESGERRRVAFGAPG